MTCNLSDVPSPWHSDAINSPALPVLEEEESSEIKCSQRWRIYLTGALKGSEVKCYDFDEKALAV